MSQRIAVALILACMLCSSAAAQVIRDNSLAEMSRGQTLSPKLGVITIPHDAGRLVIKPGSNPPQANLFHSFRTFNLARGEIADFTGPSSVKNVLTRVTGGSRSDIAGQLKCHIPNANFYFMNPAGVVFTEGASIDVKGAFVATSADSIHLADGVKFDTIGASDDLLTSAPVAAYGFARGSLNVGRITVEGVDLNSGSLSTGFALLARDLEISEGSVRCPTGRIDLAAVGDGGTVTLNHHPNKRPISISNSSQLGLIALENVTVEVGDSSQREPGTIHLRAEALTLTTSGLRSVATANHEAPVSLDLHLDGLLSMTSNSEITSGLPSSGQTGAIMIEAGGINMNASTIQVAVNLSPFPRPGESLGLGMVNVRAANAIVMVNESTIGVDTVLPPLTQGASAPDVITIRASSFSLADKSKVASGGIFPGAVGSQGGLRVELYGGDLTLSRSLFSTADTRLARLGDITVTARDIILDGHGEPSGAQDEDELGRAFGTGFFSAGGRSTQDRAGDITVTGRNIVVKGKAQLSSRAKVAAAGNINVIASDSFRLNAGTINVQGSAGGTSGIIAIDAPMVTIDAASAISAEAPIGGIGAGSINIGLMMPVEQLIIQGGSRISTTRVERAGASAPAGGEVRIAARDFQLLQNSHIAAQGISAAGGNVIIDAPDGSIYLNGNSVISASAGSADPGGSIRLAARNIVASNATIEATNTGSGTAGLLTITGNRLVQLNDGAIVAVTANTGRAGNLSVRSDATVDVTDSTISATSGGRGGSILLEAPNISISESSRLTAAVSGNERGGDVMLDGNVIKAEASTITTTTSGGGTAGDISIGTGTLLTSESVSILNGAELRAESEGTGRAGDVKVFVSGLLTLKGNATSPFTGISVDTYRGVSGGQGGDIDIRAQQVKIQNRAVISANTHGGGAGGNISINPRDAQMPLSVELDGMGDARFTGIATEARAGSGANSGNVAIRASDLAIRGGAAISANTYSTGRGGSVSVTVSGPIEIDGTGAARFTGISVQSAGDTARGPGGSFDIRSTVLEILNGGRRGAGVAANTFGEGKGGSGTITTSHLSLDSGFISASGRGTGAAGNIVIDTGSLTSIGSSIETRNTGGGAAGGIDIDSRGAVELKNSAVSATSSGVGGSINIKATKLDILSGSTVSTAVSGSEAGGAVSLQAPSVLLQNGTVSASTSGDGTGGSVNIGTMDFPITSLSMHGLSAVTAESSGTSDKAGDAGNINVYAFDFVLLRDGAVINTQAGEANAGDVLVRAGKQLVLQDTRNDVPVPIAELRRIPGTDDDFKQRVDAVQNNTRISSSAPEGGSSGGDIKLQAERIIRLQRSVVTATAGGEGAKITIDPDVVILDGSVIDGRASDGQDTVQVLPRNTPVFLLNQSAITTSNALLSVNTDVSSSLVTFDSAVQDSAARLQQACAQRFSGAFSSFVVNQRGGMPLEPGTAIGSMDLWLTPVRAAFDDLRRAEAP